MPEEDQTTSYKLGRLTGVIILLVLLTALTIAINSAVVWLAIEEIAGFTDLSFREALGAGGLLTVAQGSVTRSG